MIFEFKIAITGVIVAIPSSILWHLHGGFLAENPEMKTWLARLTQCLLEWAMAASILGTIIFVPMGFLKLLWSY